jgi:hypothetical protein
VSEQAAFTIQYCTALGGKKSTEENLEGNYKLVILHLQMKLIAERFMFYSSLSEIMTIEKEV